MNCGSMVHCGSTGTARAGRAAVVGGVLAMVLAMGAATGAAGLTLADVNPLFFPSGGANTGFDATAVAAAGKPVAFDITPESTFLSVETGAFDTGGNCLAVVAADFTVCQDLQRPVDQNPQERGSDPTPSDPFIGTSLWTFVNTSDITFDQPVALLFTNVDVVSTNPLTGAPYPDIQTGLDADLFEIARQTVGSDEFLFGAVNVGILAPEASVTLPVRYIVNGPLPFGPDLVPPEGPDLVTPPILMLGVVVPEPGTALLVGAGLLAVATGRRRRCARGA